MPHGLSKEGGGGPPPRPTPLRGPVGPLSHWSLPSHVTLLFLYKKKPLVLLLVAYTLMDDPVLSPEAQQVIEHLRTLLTQLEKDLEDIHFKASYSELLRLHSTKHLSRHELCLLTLKKKLLPVVNG